MGSGQEREDPQQMRRVVQEAVQEALAKRNGHSSSARSGRVDRGRSSSAATPTREEIRQMVAEEIAQSTHGPASGSSSSSTGQASGSSSTSKPSSQKSSPHKTGWGRFRQGSSSRTQPSSSAEKGSSRSAGGSLQGSAHESPESVAEVLGQAQWQLSEDLSANLKELRRVINQSQEIARKIEQVLGQGTSGQSE